MVGSSGLKTLVLLILMEFYQCFPPLFLIRTSGSFRKKFLFYLFMGFLAKSQYVTHFFFEFLWKIYEISEIYAVFLDSIRDFLPSWVKSLLVLYCFMPFGDLCGFKIGTSEENGWNPGVFTRNNT